MKFKCLALINFLVLQCLGILGVSFDFFYFVQQVSDLFVNKRSFIFLVFFSSSMLHFNYLVDAVARIIL